MANGYKVRIGEPTKSANGKRLMPFIMIFREEQEEESIHGLKPCMSDGSISRQAVLDAIDEIESEVVDGDGFQYEKWRQYFCELPSAEPRWIPCSERLPEKDGDYYVTYEKGYAEDYGFDLVGIAPYDADCEGFGIWQERYDPISLGYLDSDFVDIKVTAWMPLPEPWKGGDESDKD